MLIAEIKSINVQLPKMEDAPKEGIFARIICYVYFYNIIP